MELLGVGPLEFVFVVLIALIVIGPRHNPTAARAAGRFLNRMYRSDTWRAVVQASRNLRTLPNRLAREAELEDLRQIRQDLDATAHDVTREARELESGLRARTGPSPRAQTEASPATTDAGPESAGTE
jgi:Sec-independent protein translocase protein TatA